MFHLDNNSGVSAMPPVGAVQSSAPRWYTEGGGGTPASYPGADWYNIIQAELLNLLSAYGINPNKSDFNQLQHAIEEAISQNATANSALLTAIAALVTSANKMPYFTGKDKVAMTDLTAFARTLLGRSDAAGVLSDLHLGDASGTVGRLLGKPRVYPSSSKYDDPTPGTKFVIVEVQGAGGSGANTGFTGSGEASIASGGSAGGYACSLLKIDQAINQIITVGAGGNINSGAPAEGRPGGTSSFGNLIICAGGSGGHGQARSTPPFSCTGVVGGTATGGNIINKSGDASTGGIAVGSSAILCGNGGSSKFGTGGFTPTNINTNGRAAIGCGAGGGGAISYSQPNAGNTGGTGSGGIIIIWEYA